MVSVFRTKDLHQLLGEVSTLDDDRSLRRSLTALDITLLGLGVMIGTGIFVLTGIVAAQYAGPGLMLSFVLAAVVCTFICLAYSELASLIPVAGSSYTYAYVSLGEVFGWLVGWSLILEYTVGASAVAGGWSAYFTSILADAGIHLPKALTAVPAEGGIMNLPAILIVGLAVFFLLRGIRESATANRVLVFVKIGTIFLFLLLAGPHVNPANWTPFLPYGWAGVSAGTAVLFFSYLGFDSLSTASEEARNPGRDMPIGIIAALTLTTLLYIAVSAVMTGVLPYTELDTAAPASYVLQRIGSHFGSALIGTGAICGLSTVLLVMIYAQTRAFYAMSRDGLIPEKLCHVHPKYRTPHRVTLLVGAAVALISGFTPIHIVAEMCSAGTIFAFLCSCIGLLVLRKRYPDMPRRFTCPAPKIIAPLGFLSCFYVFTQLSAHTLELFTVWFFLGLLVYFFYGRRHSRLNKMK
ncbi:MAG: amino acid permease [Veillonellaceae bacterium]|nr:amino acid permease [Veillonellaceae bacterium]